MHLPGKSEYYIYMLYQKPFKDKGVQYIWNCEVYKALKIKR